jgi:hypothetical protein
MPIPLLKQDKHPTFFSFLAEKNIDSLCVNLKKKTNCIRRRADQIVAVHILHQEMKMPTQGFDFTKNK